jgi:hypothetical protein
MSNWSYPTDIRFGAGLMLSAVIFVPAYPVAWPFSAGDDVLELCITEPTDRLFRKPLGDL